MSETTKCTEAIFAPAQLRYAARARCTCGAGLAYPFEGIRNAKAWACSAVLTGAAKPDAEHDEPKPFAFWEIKSEIQPSAGGATTRPDEPDGQRTMHRQVEARDRIEAAIEAVRIARVALDKSEKDATDLMERAVSDGLMSREDGLQLMGKMLHRLGGGLTL